MTPNMKALSRDPPGLLRQTAGLFSSYRSLGDQRPGPGPRTFQMLCVTAHTLCDCSKKLPAQRRFLDILYNTPQLLRFLSLKGVIGDEVGPLSLQAKSASAGNEPESLGTRVSLAQDGVGMQVFSSACFMGRIAKPVILKFEVCSLNLGCLQSKFPAAHCSSQREGVGGEFLPAIL